MAWVTEETRGKIFVLVIISGCVGAALLLGMVIFELQEKETEVVKDKNETEQRLTEKWISDISAIEKANELLKLYPIIDGHNDFPWNLRNLAMNDLRKFLFDSDLRKVEPWGSYNESHTDIPRLRKGRVGAQFWVAYTECDSQFRDSVTQTLEQIDVIHRLVEKYKNDLEFCDSSSCITQAVRKNKIASLIGIEGGHSIASSPGVLRQMYRLGARYLTLTHKCNTPWADASPVDADSSPIKAVNKGISPFGLEFLDEMNRIGMMIDLSHVSRSTMEQALARSKAPVIFSHSSVKAICNHHRNVGDDVLQLLKQNDGIIMINFHSKFIQCNPNKNATIDDVILHMEHVRHLIGAEHIGLGADYDGVDSVPKGLEDVSKYPNLIAKLIERNWTIDELKGVTFLNLVRVMKQVELISQKWDQVTPMQNILVMDEFQRNYFNQVESCSSPKSLANLVGR